MLNLEDFFRHHVDSIVRDMPDEFRNKLDNVNFFIEKGLDNPNLLGLYEGVPHTRRKNYGVGGAMPDKITIFIYPILSRSRSEDELVQKIKDTIYHEVGHHFGMSEAEIRRASRKVH
jgi:predicted Zn-dependent protease with MMP-like domain